MIREIPSLSITLLKMIAKTPQQCITKDTIRRAFKLCPDHMKEAAAQLIVDFIAEAGRLTDDVEMIFPFDVLKVSLRNSKLSGHYIVDLTSKCTRILDLNVSGCFQVMDDTILSILKNTRLIKINFRNCRKTTDLSIDHLVRHGPSLFGVNIGGNFNITAHGIQKLLDHQNITKFQELHLSGLPISEKHIEIISHRCLSLQGLSLAYAVLSESSLLSLLRSIGGKIEELNIGWTSVSTSGEHVSNAFFEQMAQMCPRLTLLDISGLKNVNGAVIHEILEFKASKSSEDPVAWRPFNCIAAKFSAITKQQSELLSSSYLSLKIDI